VCNPVGPKREGTAEIVFMGNDYKGTFPCSAERTQMVRMLQQRYGSRFAVHGSGWDAPNFLQEPDEAAAYRACKIAINQNHYDAVPKFTSDRIFRLMGSGAFCLSNYWPGMEEDFEIGTHLVTYPTIEHLPALIDYYLDHVDERQQIAKRGCQHVHAHHSWDARMVDLLRIAKQAAEAKGKVLC